MAGLTAVPFLGQRGVATPVASAVPPTIPAVASTSTTMTSSQMEDVIRGAGLKPPTIHEKEALMKSEGISAAEASKKLYTERIKDVERPELVLEVYTNIQEQQVEARKKGMTLVTPAGTPVVERDIVRFTAERVGEQTAWEKDKVQDPKTGEWYKRSDIEEMYTIPKAAVKMFETAGLEGIKRHTEAVRSRREAAIKPYEVEGGGHDISALAVNLKSKGLNQKSTQARIEELGFTPEVAASATSHAYLSPEKRFQSLVKQGTIPADSSFAGVDSAGNVLYSDPLAGLAYTATYNWRATPGAKENPPSNLKDWWKYRQGLVDTDATPKQLDAEWRRYLQSNIVRARDEGVRMPLVAPATLTAGVIQQEAKVQTAKGIVTPVPILGTVALWNDMSPTWRGISVAADVLFALSPVIPKAIVVLKGLGNARGAMAAKQSLVAHSTRLMELLPDKALVAPAKKLLGTQTKYVDDYLRVKEIKRGLEAGFPGDLASVERSLQLAQESLGRSESALRGAQKGYVNAVGAGERFVDPRWFAHFEGLRHDVVKWTRQLADVWDSPARLNASIIRKELAQAEQAFVSVKAVESTALDRLKAVATRWDAAGQPMRGGLRTELLATRKAVATAESNSAKLLEDIALAKAKLLKIGAEDITTVSGRLAAARENAVGLEKLVVDARKAGSPYLPDLEKSLGEVRSLVTRYENETAELLRLMKAEHLGTGPVTRGGSGRVATMEPPRLTGSVGGIRVLPKKSIKPLLSPAVSRSLVASLGFTEAAFGKKEFTKIATEVERISESATARIAGVAPESVRDATWDAIREATIHALEEATIAFLRGKTDTEVERVVENALRGDAKAAVATEAEVEAITESVVKTATDIGTRIRNRITTAKGRVLVPPMPVADVAKESKMRVPPGSITWAQGWDWKYIPPPYTDLKPQSLGHTPPRGALHTGSNIPTETLQIIGRAGSRSGVPRRVAIDLGWADIFIRDGKRIEFRGGGEVTNVGGRIDSPVRGMSIGSDGRSVSRLGVATGGEDKHFFDETEDFWAGLNKTSPGQKSVNRPRLHRKPLKRTRRKDNTPSSQLGTMRP